MTYKIDLMAKFREFKTKNIYNKDVRFSAKKVEGEKYDIWIQSSTKKIRDTLELVLNELEGFENLPTIVILKYHILECIAGYDRIKDVVYVSDELNSEKNINKVLSNGYFASKNLKDILTHELTHKKHWDSAKKLYNERKKRYNNIEEAKKDLDSQLISYVKHQVSIDRKYLSDISQNTKAAYSNKNINELVAEVMVLGDNIKDKELLNKVKGVLGWK